MISSAWFSPKRRARQGLRLFFQISQARHTFCEHRRGQYFYVWNSDYVFLCGVMWCRFGPQDACEELIRAADSPDLILLSS